jgi:pSer/pThr/pTyr-binding forkhead associated (FHA) protein
LAELDSAEGACDPADTELKTIVKDERNHHMASVIVTTGDQKGEFLPLGRRTSVIGRAENLPLQIREDLISRKHLRIRFDEETGGYFAEDMGSHNGVYINNKRIAGKTLLA